MLVGVGPDELTTAFSAYGGASEMVEPLGQRIPLIPPIGEAYVAGAAPEVVEHWLVQGESEGRRSSSSSTAPASRRSSAAARASRSWAPTARSDYERLGEALREYGAGELTPAREREFRSLLASTRCFFEDRELVADEAYNVGGIVVPVRNPEGDISMVLRATQLPPEATGARGRGVDRNGPAGRPRASRRSSPGPPVGARCATTASGDADFPM